MKHEQFCGLQSGKLVCQIPRGVTFSYDLWLGWLRDHWKGLTEEYNSEMGLVESLKQARVYDYFLGCCEAKKTSFSASKWPRKSRTRKIMEK